MKDTPNIPRPSGFRRNSIVGTLVLFLSALGVLKRLARDYEGGGGGWRQGDWLINSAAGPVRRAPFGDAVLALSEALNCNPVTLIILIQTALVLIFFSVVWLALRRVGWSSSLVLMAACPACLLFWPYDPVGALRKELLVYVALALITLAPRSRTAIVLATTGFAVAVFAHEALILFLPVMLVALWQLSRAAVLGRLPIFAAAACVAVSGAAGLFAVQNSVVSDTAAICDAVVQLGASASVCRGAIGFLVHTSEAQLESRLASLNMTTMLPFSGHVGLTLLTFVLAWPGAKQKWTVAVGTVLAFVLFLPLTLVASDHGRWVNFAAMSVFFLLLLRQRLVLGSNRNGPHALGGPAMTLVIRPRMFWAVLVLNGLWLMPHYPTAVVGRPVVPEFLDDIRKYVPRALGF